MTKPLDPEEKKRRQEERSKAAAARNPRYRTKEERKKGAGDTTGIPPVTPETRVRKTPVCGEKRTGRSSSGEGICCMPAGWGTEHLGTGPCKLHRGNTPANNKRAVIQHAMQQAAIYGDPRTIDPENAVLQELYRTAGHVEWLGEQVRQLENPGKLLQYTDAGLKPAAILDLYQSERSHLIKVAKVAKDMGIQERQIQLAEEQGRLVAMAVQRFMEDPDLALTPTQRITGRIAMRRALEFVDAHVVADSHAPEALVD